MPAERNDTVNHPRDTHVRDREQPNDAGNRLAADGESGRNRPEVAKGIRLDDKVDLQGEQWQVKGAKDGKILLYQNGRGEYFAGQIEILNGPPDSTKYTELKFDGQPKDSRYFADKEGRVYRQKPLGDGKFIFSTAHDATLVQPEQVVATSGDRRAGAQQTEAARERNNKVGDVVRVDGAPFKVAGFHGDNALLFQKGRNEDHPILPVSVNEQDLREKYDTVQTNVDGKIETRYVSKNNPTTVYDYYKGRLYPDNQFEIRPEQSLGQPRAQGDQREPRQDAPPTETANNPRDLGREFVDSLRRADLESLRSLASELVKQPGEKATELVGQIAKHSDEFKQAGYDVTASTWKDATGEHARLTVRDSRTGKVLNFAETGSPSVEVPGAGGAQPKKLVEGDSDYSREISKFQREMNVRMADVPRDGERALEAHYGARFFEGPDGKISRYVRQGEPPTEYRFTETPQGNTRVDLFANGKPTLSMESLGPVRRDGNDLQGNWNVTHPDGVDYKWTGGMTLRAATSDIAFLDSQGEMLVDKNSGPDYLHASAREVKAFTDAIRNHDFATAVQKAKELSNIPGESNIKNVQEFLQHQASALQDAGLKFDVSVDYVDRRGVAGIRRVPDAKVSVTDSATGNTLEFTSKGERSVRVPSPEGEPAKVYREGSPEFREAWNKLEDLKPKEAIKPDPRFGAADLAKVTDTGEAVVTLGFDENSRRRIIELNKKHSTTIIPAEDAAKLHLETVKLHGREQEDLKADKAGNLYTIDRDGTVKRIEDQKLVRDSQLSVLTLEDSLRIIREPIPNEYIARVMLLKGRKYEPGMEVNYRGTDGGPGHVLSVDRQGDAVVQLDAKKDAKPIQTTQSKNNLIPIELNPPEPGKKFYRVENLPHVYMEDSAHPAEAGKIWVRPDLKWVEGSSRWVHGNLPQTPAGAENPPAGDGRRAAADMGQARADGAERQAESAPPPAKPLEKGDTVVRDDGAWKVQDVLKDSGLAVLKQNGRGEDWVMNFDVVTPAEMKEKYVPFEVDGEKRYFKKGDKFGTVYSEFSEPTRDGKRTLAPDYELKVTPAESPVGGDVPARRRRGAGPTDQRQDGGPAEEADRARPRPARDDQAQGRRAEAAQPANPATASEKPLEQGDRVRIDNETWDVHAVLKESGLTVMQLKGRGGDFARIIDAATPNEIEHQYVPFEVDGEKRYLRKGDRTGTVYRTIKEPLPDGKIGILPDNELKAFPSNILDQAAERVDRAGEAASPRADAVPPTAVPEAPLEKGANVNFEGQSWKIDDVLKDANLAILKQEGLGRTWPVMADAVTPAELKEKYTQIESNGKKLYTKRGDETGTVYEQIDSLPGGNGRISLLPNHELIAIPTQRLADSAGTGTAAVDAEARPERRSRSVRPGQEYVVDGEPVKVMGVDKVERVALIESPKDNREAEKRTETGLELIQSNRYIHFTVDDKDYHLEKKTGTVFEMGEWHGSAVDLVEVQGVKGMRFADLKAGGKDAPRSAHDSDPNDFEFKDANGEREVNGHKLAVKTEGEGLRMVTIDGTDYWFRGSEWFKVDFEGPDGQKLRNGDVKLHIATVGPADLAKVQVELIPELAKAAAPGGPLFGKLAGYKTHDPMYSVQEGWEERLRDNQGRAEYFMPGDKGQNAKGVTLYPTNPQAAQEVYDYVSNFLAQKGVKLEGKVDSGNVADFSLDKDKSNRVSLERDIYELGKRGSDKGALLPLDLNDAMKELAEKRAREKAPGWEEFKTRADLYEGDPAIGHLKDSVLSRLARECNLDPVTTTLTYAERTQGVPRLLYLTNDVSSKTKGKGYYLSEANANREVEYNAEGQLVKGLNGRRGLYEMSRLAGEVLGKDMDPARMAVAEGRQLEGARQAGRVEEAPEPVARGEATGATPQALAKGAAPGTAPNAGGNGNGRRPATGGGDIREGEGGQYEVARTNGGAREAQADRVEKEDIAAMRAEILKADEGKISVADKARALKVLDLAEAGHPEAMEALIKARKEQSSQRGFDRTTGALVGIAIVVAALSAWYAYKRMTEAREAYVPKAPVN